MLKKFLQLAAIGSAIALGCGLSGSAQAISFGSISQVYFFGDSLSDSGFNDLYVFTGPLPAGKAPTFTTYSGYTWSQYIARDVKGFTLPIYPGPSPADTITNNGVCATGACPSPAPYPINTYQAYVSTTLKGVDYAAGGSTTNSYGNGEFWAPSLVSQVKYYLNTHNSQADPNAVYFIWSGANDILTLLSAPTLPSQLQLLIASQTAAVNVANQVALLSQYGAKRIVVMSLPNIGLTPLIGGAAASTHQPTLPATFKSVTYTFNSMLNTALGTVMSQYPNVKILYVDVYDLLDGVILAVQAGQPYSIGGQSFPFVNYTTPACGNVVSAIYCPNGTPLNYVFADTLHPTNMAHRVLSLDVEILLQNWQ